MSLMNMSGNVNKGSDNKSEKKVLCTLIWIFYGFYLTLAKMP